MTITINGTTGIAGVDGSNTSPAIQGSDTNTGISFGTDTVNINTGGTTKATVDSNGKVGIGTTTLNEHLNLKATGDTFISFQNDTTGTGTGDGSIIGIDTVGSSTTNSMLRINNKENGDIAFLNDNVEKVRIYPNGHIISRRQDIGYIYNYRRVSGTGAITGGTELFIVDNLSNESSTRMRIRNPNGVINYNSSSDYRLKENDVKITDGIEKVKKLRPIRFKWKTGTNIYDGFFAHEVSEACPTAVDGTKDQVATADDVTKGFATNVGDPIYQGIDHGKMIPLLTAALQEAIAKIEVLETKVAALEAG